VLKVGFPAAPAEGRPPLCSHQQGITYSNTDILVPDVQCHDAHEIA